MHYCRIQNPVVYDVDSGEPVLAFPESDEGDNIQVKVKTGEEEIRFYNYMGRQEPFALYPGEKLIGTVKKQSFIPKDTAYLVQALRDFTDESSTT